jgi:hypothetical protein
MPIGNALPAQGFKIEVAAKATPTVFSPVGLMHTFDVSTATNVAEFDTFDSPNPITFSGNPRRTLSVTGYLADDDAGQQILLDAAAAGDTVILKFLWDGTNGFTQEVRVNSYRGSGRAGNNPIDVTFDFTGATAAGTIVMAGPLL